MQIEKFRLDSHFMVHDKTWWSDCHGKSWAMEKYRWPCNAHFCTMAGNQHFDHWVSKTTLSTRTCEIGFVKNCVKGLNVRKCRKSRRSSMVPLLEENTSLARFLIITDFSQNFCKQWISRIILANNRFLAKVLQIMDILQDSWKYIARNVFRERI